MTEPIPILIVWITPWNDKARISPGDYHSKTDLGHKLLYIFFRKNFFSEISLKFGIIFTGESEQVYRFCIVWIQ